MLHTQLLLCQTISIIPIKENPKKTKKPWSLECHPPKKHHTHPTDASAYEQHFFFLTSEKDKIFSKKRDVLIKRKECVLKSDAIIPAYRYLGQHMNQILKVRLIIGFQDGSYLTIILTL